MGWEALPEVGDGSGDPPGGLGRVRKPSRRSGTGREAFLEVRDGSEVSPRSLGRV